MEIDQFEQLKIIFFLSKQTYKQKLYSHLTSDSKVTGWEQIGQRYGRPHK